MPSLRALLDDLKDRGRISDEQIAAVTDWLEHRTTASDTPWYLQAMVAFGAWIAAIFFLLFLLATFVSWRDTSSMLGWGLALIVGATVLWNLQRALFALQFALAISVTGHLMLFIGVGSSHNSLSALAGVAVAACAILYGLYRDPLHRFLSVLTAIAFVGFWLGDVAQSRPLLHLLTLGEAVGLGWLLAGPGRLPRAAAPLAYALAVALPGTLLVLQYFKPEWPSTVVLTLWLLWLARWAATGSESRSLVPAIGAVVLGAISTPGILAAIGLMALGHGRGDRVLLSLGAAFLPVFLVFYYYNMDVTLAMKSWVLMGSGAVLLLLREALSRYAVEAP